VKEGLVLHSEHKPRQDPEAWGGKSGNGDAPVDRSISDARASGEKKERKSTSPLHPFNPDPSRPVQACHPPNTTVEMHHRHDRLSS
jgi:hypothetical protein